MNIFHFKKKYLLLTILLFLVEVFIAKFVHDRFIRPFFGDFLVVILLYFFAKTFWNASSKTIAISVLIFSFVVEILQYFKIVEILGLKGNRLAEIVIGTSFSWLDLVAYTLGVLTVYWLDTRTAKSLD